MKINIWSYLQHLQHIYTPGKFMKTTSSYQQSRRVETKYQEPTPTKKIENVSGKPKMYSQQYTLVLLQERYNLAML